MEKLAVKAPDGPTKIKILTEIATQHNVTWEPESLVESEPKEPILLVSSLSSMLISRVSFSLSVVSVSLVAFSISLSRVEQVPFSHQVE